MSRYRDEDWERRKSYLIRCLLHNVPYTALSPVLEDSEPELTQPVKSPCVTSQARGDVSPLPPLVIEPVPNKHDEPREHYVTLLRKIRAVYRRMFIEGRNLSDEDYFYSEHEQSVTTEIVHEIDHNEASAHTPLYSDGYSGDYESSDGTDNIESTESTNRLSELISNKEIECEQSIELNKDINNPDVVMAEETSDRSEVPQLREVAPEGVAHRQLVDVDEHATLADHERGARSDVPHFVDSVVARSAETCVDLHTPHIVQGVNVPPTDARTSLMLENQDTNDIQGRAEGGEQHVEVTQQVTTARTRHGHADGDADHTGHTPCVTLSGEENKENISSDHIEVMRSHKPETTRHSFPLDTTRLSTDMELTLPHNTMPRDISSVTSHSQNGRRDTATSYNIEDVLSSIVNENLINKSVDVPVSTTTSRKRPYDASSECDVSWNSLRNNFFVGAPKILRLCSCVDHVCN